MEWISREKVTIKGKKRIYRRRKTMEKSEGELWELKNHLDEKVQVRPRGMRGPRRLRKNSWKK